MPLKVTKGEPGGIYQEETREWKPEDGKLPRTKRDFRELGESIRLFAESWDIRRELSLLEAAARKIIKKCGGTPGLLLKKRGGKVVGGTWFPLPTEAPVIGQRARDLIFEIWAARDYLREDKCEDAAMAAYLVGRGAEVVRVSPHEPAAKVGAKTLRAQFEGHKLWSAMAQKKRDWCLDQLQTLRPGLSDNARAKQIVNRWEKDPRMSGKPPKQETVRKYLRQARSPNPISA